MSRANVDPKKVKNCVEQSGGTRKNGQNTILQAQMEEYEQNGINQLPSLYVNGVPIRGAFDFVVVFKTVCAGFKDGTEPKICDQLDAVNKEEAEFGDGTNSDQIGNDGVPPIEQKEKEVIKNSEQLMKEEEEDKNAEDDDGGNTTASSSALIAGALVGVLTATLGFVPYDRFGRQMLAGRHGRLSTTDADADVEVQLTEWNKKYINSFTID